MKNINNEKLNQLINKNKKILYLGIVFLLITIGCIYWVFKISSNLEEIKHITNLVGEEKQDNRNVYTNTSVEPYKFAEDEDYNKTYYLVMDENSYLYIVTLTDEKYNEVVNKLNNSDYVTLTGASKYISEDLKELAISNYNNLLDNEILTNNNFESYLGNVYLDVDVDYHDYSGPIIIGYLSGIISIILLTIGITSESKTKATFSKINTSDLYKLYDELHGEIVEYNNLILTKNYIVSNSNGIDIISYRDLKLVYPCTYRYNGGQRESLIYYLNDKKKRIVTLKLGFKKSNMSEELIKIITEKNPDVLVGNTKENKNRIKGY